MDTRRDADRIDSLKQLRQELSTGSTNGRKVSPAEAARETRALDREIATLERLHQK